MPTCEKPRFQNGDYDATKNRPLDQVQNSNYFLTKKQKYRRIILFTIVVVTLDFCSTDTLFQKKQTNKISVVERDEKVDC